MNRLVALVLISFIAVFSSNALAISVKATLCDSCTIQQARQAALITAGSDTRYGVTVFVSDFDRDLLYKFFLLDENNPLAPDGQYKGFIDFIEEISGYSKILDQQVIEKGDLNRSSVNIAQLDLTEDEARDFDELDWLVSWLDSRGYPTRGNVNTRGEDHPPVVFNWNVPSGAGFDSAFGIMDFGARTRALGGVAINASPTIANALAGLSFTSDVARLDNIISLDFAYEFHFSDGSSGIWAFNNRGELDAIPGTFRDGDGNDIPQTADDVNGMHSFFGNTNSSGFQDTRDRVIAFGFSVVGSAGGGSCSFVCGPEVCTVTCQIE